VGVVNSGGYARLYIEDDDQKGHQLWGKNCTHRENPGYACVLTHGSHGTRCVVVFQFLAFD